MSSSSLEPVWTENHDNFLRLMKLGKVADMKELIMKIDPKASHIFRNVSCIKRNVTLK